MKNKTNKNEFKDITTYGKDILRSESFKKCQKTRHHFNTTVGKHTLNVTVQSLKISNWLNDHNIKTDKKRLILACLSHDLSLGEKKYEKGKKLTAAWRHPIDSAKIASDITEIHKNTEKVIKRHMWPICIVAPTCKEGWIIIVTDKICAIQEIFKLGK